jgi:hypothetical protein
LVVSENLNTLTNDSAPQATLLNHLAVRRKD